MAVNKYITDKNHHHNLLCPFSSRTGGDIFLYGVIHAFTYVVFTTSTPVVFDRRIPLGLRKETPSLKPSGTYLELDNHLRLEGPRPTPQSRILEEDALYEIPSENVHAYHL